MAEGNQMMNNQKGFLGSPNLLKYILKTNVYPRENNSLKEIREALKSHPRGYMCSAPEEGQLLSVLLKLMNAKKTMEIGVFAGYSLLTTALAIPDDGKILAIDPDREAYEIGLPYIKKAGVEHKIEFIQGEGIPTINKLLSEEEELDSFDFIFLDADKLNYALYHDLLMKLVRVGGAVVYANTLWCGSVADPGIKPDIEDQAMADFFERVRHSMVEFNQKLASDAGAEITQLGVGDGLTLCCRLK